MSYLFTTYELFFQIWILVCDQILNKKLPSAPNQFCVNFHEKSSRRVLHIIQLTILSFPFCPQQQSVPGTISTPLDFLGFKARVNLSQYKLVRGQVDFQFTCPDGQVEILNKTIVINMNDHVFVIWAS